MRKIIINILWIIAIFVVVFLPVHVLESYLEQYPEMIKIGNIVLAIFWAIIAYEAFKLLYRTKKIIYVVQILGLLIIGYAHIVRHYPQYIPHFITEYQINNMMSKNKNFIDEILILHKNAIGGNFDAFTYCLQVLMEYQRWFEDNKYFIDQRPYLKELLRKELKQAMTSLKIKAYDKESLGYYIVNYFKENVAKLNEQ